MKERLKTFSSKVPIFEKIRDSVYDQNHRYHKDYYYIMNFDNIRTKRVIKSIFEAPRTRLKKCPLYDINMEEIKELLLWFDSINDRKLNHFAFYTSTGRITFSYTPVVDTNNGLVIDISQKNKIVILTLTNKPGIDPTHILTFKNEKTCTVRATRILFRNGEDWVHGLGTDTDSLLFGDKNRPGVKNKTGYAVYEFCTRNDINPLNPTEDDILFLNLWANSFSPQ